MARTLSHIVTPSAPKKNAPQDDVLAMCWGCIAELWMIADRVIRVTAARARLNDQLNQPNAAEKSGYVDALGRYSRWGAELDGHQMRLGPLLANLAKHYDKLNERNRMTLVANEGWSQALEGKALAEDMWQRAKGGVDFPCGECGFLDPLRAWLEETMARERGETEK